MNYWLLKSEPYKFSWDDLIKAKQEPWDGIRNYLARNNMRQMRVGDLAFFYHSNEGLSIVGIAKIVRETYPDHTFPGKINAKGELVNPWEMVDITPVKPLNNPVTLADVKAKPALENMALVTSMRLSVQPVTPTEWAEILRMGNTIL